eukprot:scaffold314194_cov21-Tisochrysis_lutea.AAC.1
MAMLFVSLYLTCRVCLLNNNHALLVGLVCTSCATHHVHGMYAKMVALFMSLRLAGACVLPLIGSGLGVNCRCVMHTDGATLVLDAMRQDAEIEGMPLLRVDGGATKSDLLMQIQVRGVGDATCADPSWCRSEYAEWHPVRWERPVCHA